MMRVNHKVVGCIMFFAIEKAKYGGRSIECGISLAIQHFIKSLKVMYIQIKMDKAICPCKTCMLTYSHQHSGCFPGIEPTPNCLVDMIYTNSRKQNDVLAAIIIVLLLITFIVFEYFWIVLFYNKFSIFKNIFWKPWLICNPFWKFSLSKFSALQYFYYI